MNRIAFFLVIFLLICSCAQSQSRQDIDNLMVDGVVRKLGDINGPGYSIAVIKAFMLSGSKVKNLKFNKNIN